MRFRTVLSEVPVRSAISPDDMLRASSCNACRIALSTSSISLSAMVETPRHGYFTVVRRAFAPTPAAAGVREIGRRAPNRASGAGSDLEVWRVERALVGLHVVPLDRGEREFEGRLRVPA